MSFASVFQDFNKKNLDLELKNENRPILSNKVKNGLKLQNKGEKKGHFAQKGGVVALHDSTHVAS